MKKKEYYAVAVGRRIGIFSKWFGKKGAQIQVKGFQGSIYKKFSLLEDAEKFIENNVRINKKQLDTHNFRDLSHLHRLPHQKKTEIYTDGCSLGNPGPGGYGTIIVQNGKQKELSGGFRYTTNNRMELMACIIGIRDLVDESYIKLHSDSKYVIDGISKGWAKQWEKNKWLKNNKEKAKNSDLWKELLKLCSAHKIDFNWIKGHDGNPNNEQCDKIAKIAANGDDLKKDKGYEKSLKQSQSPSKF